MPVYLLVVDILNFGPPQQYWHPHSYKPLPWLNVSALLKYMISFKMNNSISAQNSVRWIKKIRTQSRQASSHHVYLYCIYIVLEPLALSAGLVAQKKKNLCGRLSLLPVNCKSLCKPISKTFTDPDLLTKHRTFNWIFFFHSIQLLPPGCRFQYTGFSKKKTGQLHHKW